MILNLIRDHREEQMIRAICAVLGAYNATKTGAAARRARRAPPSHTAGKRSHRR